MFSAQVSGTRNLGGELGSCAMGLSIYVDHTFRLKRGFHPPQRTQRSQRKERNEMTSNDVTQRIQ